MQKLALPIAIVAFVIALFALSQIAPPLKIKGTYYDDSFYGSGGDAPSVRDDAYSFDT